jgi:N-acetylmuramoyl-L-alanine amidase CwlA
MKIIQSILTNNPCYKAGRKITVKGLMLHSVGCPQPSASVFIKNWNRAEYDRACVHAFIDGNNGNVYQTLPWNHRGWHGGGKCNDTHIGVEMCEPACIKYTGGSTFTCTDKATARAVTQRTYDTAVALFAHLCAMYNLDPLTDIISHKEGAAKGIASNHGDPEHLWNQLGMGYTMNTFRKAVKVAMNGDTSYKVKITASVLNVRGGVGINYPITTTVRRGEIYTIVGESMKGSTKWGKLKSGAGWISLKYTQRI